MSETSPTTRKGMISRDEQKGEKEEKIFPLKGEAQFSEKTAEEQGFPRLVDPSNSGDSKGSKVRRSWL